ncbi:YceI family protein [Streptomyces cylindrosporus]|uniref:YceI family protein n=1 Tax=Streptomyces cylindrosporus TaxID=2927583 RepID=A0ABS9YPS4_9ACTN|nr:YceI family protein [Streptomyces cylindrosporus]MCI3278849.1 YceI family protein [Streptomyces cylindrosporus]
MTTTRAGGLRARLRTKDGWAVPHAVLTVTDMAGRQTLRQEASPEGVVATDALAPGTYTVIVTAVGYAPVASTAIVSASGGADLGSLVLARAGGVELPPPGPWTIDPAHSTVSAVAQHLGLTSVHGRFKEFGGRVEVAENPLASSVEAVIEASSIDTGHAMRDGHLRSADFLDVDVHPKITFRSTGISPAGEARWTVHGELVLHGVARPVDLDLSYLGTGPDPWGGVRASFRATTELRREDFAMNYNQVVQAGIAAIGATLRVELDIQAVRGEQLPPVA